MNRKKASDLIKVTGLNSYQINV